jgi:hypothetical protein
MSTLHHHRRSVNGMHYAKVAKIAQSFKSSDLKKITAALKRRLKKKKVNRFNRPNTSGTHGNFFNDRAL